VQRRQLLEEPDRPALKPLPTEPCVFAEWRVRRVAAIIPSISAGKPWRERDYEQILGHLRITRAGRRGELLFQAKFCLRAELDELVYSHLMIMWPLVGLASIRRPTMPIHGGRC
jgi:hypothetical protein